MIFVPRPSFRWLISFQRKKKLGSSVASRLTPVSRQSGLVRISEFLPVSFLLNEGNNVMNLRFPFPKAGFQIEDNGRGYAKFSNVRRNLDFDSEHFLRRINYLGFVVSEFGRASATKRTAYPRVIFPDRRENAMWSRHEVPKKFETLP